MPRINGAFIEGDAIQGAASYQLAEHFGENITRYGFLKSGFINASGEVSGESLKIHHTDFIEISRLRDYEGHCVGKLGDDHKQYPTVLFFNDVRKLLIYFYAEDINYKTTLTVDEIKFLVKDKPFGTEPHYVVFNSDYEKVLDDYIYASEGANYSQIDTKQIIQSFDNHGSISLWTDDTKFESNYAKIKLGEEKEVRPITKSQLDGKLYYFKFSVPLKVETNEGIITQTVEGYLYVDRQNLYTPLKATNLKYKDMQATGSVEKYKSIVLETNYGDVTLAKLDEKYLYGSISIDSDDGAFTVYCSDDWMRTDFIPVESLTDDLTVTIDGEEAKYCVGCFDTSWSAVTRTIMFYSDMDYSTPVYWETPQNKYLTAAEVKELSTKNGFGKVGNYVIFQSKPVEIIEQKSFENSGYIDKNGEIVEDAQEKHTNIIPIKNLRNNNEGFCVDIRGNSLGSDALLFAGSTLDTFISEYSFTGGVISIGALERHAESVGATHVAFNGRGDSSFYYELGGYEPLNVSVGGIWLPLSKYEKLKDNKKHNLAVRALVANGDELFSDSDYSDDVEYFYTYPSCQLQIDNELNGFDVNVIYQVYENGNNVTKTIDVLFEETMFDNMVTGSEIIINENIYNPTIVLEDNSQFTADHRYDGNKTYITVPNYKNCTLLI